MDTASGPMHITLNQETSELLKDDFLLTSLGERKIKGFGTQSLFSLNGVLGGRRF
jgi:hypothetical protein